MTIIGGADGPTQIYLASSSSWFSLFGLIIVLLLLLPNFLYARKHKQPQNRCKSWLINTLEQIGRYCCMLLMVFNVDIFEKGFASVQSLVVYVLGSGTLLLLYWVFWLVYCRKPSVFTAVMLAVLPTLLFLLCGLTLRRHLLTGFALLFGAAHIYITLVNAKAAREDEERTSE